MKFSSFFKVFYTLRFATLLIWFCVLVTCGFFALDFLSLTNLNFIPPDGSPAAEADAVVKAQFPEDYNRSRFIALMQLTSKKNKKYPDILAGNWTWKTTDLIIQAAKDFDDEDDILDGYMGRYTFEGQYDPTDPYDLRFLNDGFVSKNNRSSILILATKEKGTQRVMDWIRYMRGKFEDMDKVDGTFTIDLIGFDTLDCDMTDGASADLKFMDAVSLPIALFVFIAILRSVTVAIIPIFSVASSVLLSFTIMVPIAKAISIPSYAPAIMMSIEIAMNIDYSLFLLTRFHEELNNGCTAIEAAEKMLRYSGETILKSGLVFTVCLSSLAVFPLRVIQGIGISAVVGLQSTMLVALTLIPSLICVGSCFFAIPGLVPCVQKTESGPCCGLQCVCCCDKKSPSKHERNRKIVSAKVKFEEDKKRHWYRFADWVTKPLNAAIVIIGVLALLTPFCCGMLTWETVINEDHVLPRKSETHDAIARFSKEWPVGELYTFDVIAVPKDKNETLFNEEFFEVFHNLALTITTNASHYFNMSGVLSPCDLANETVNFETAQFLVALQQFAYMQIYNQQFNSNQSAAKMTLASKVNPNLNASEIPLALRPILDNYTKHSNYSFYLSNQIVDMADAVAYTFDVLPYIILAIAGVIVVMVIVAFQAPALSIHMLFTIAITIVWSYGVVGAIFSTDWFYWVSNNLKTTPGVCWVLPIITLPVLIGLALDYNFFLFTRIHEFRQRGWAPRAAVIMGVTKGGEVILYAGVIMAVAFSGMAFSGIMLLNQAAVLLSLGVLLDTYVISTTINPALIYVFDFLNYWPRKFPIKHKDASEFTEDLEEGIPPTPSRDRDIQTIGASEETPLIGSSGSTSING